VGGEGLVLYAGSGLDGNPLHAQNSMPKKKGIGGWKEGKRFLFLGTHEIFFRVIHHRS